MTAMPSSLKERSWQLECIVLLIMKSTSLLVTLSLLTTVAQCGVINDFTITPASTNAGAITLTVVRFTPRTSFIGSSTAGLKIAMSWNPLTSPTVTSRPPSSTSSRRLLDVSTCSFQFPISATCEVAFAFGVLTMKLTIGTFNNASQVTIVITNFKNPLTNPPAPTVQLFQDLSAIALDTAIATFPPISAPTPASTPALPTSSTAAGSTLGVAVGASVGGVVCVILLVAAVWRWRKYISQVHSCSSLVHVFFPCS